MALLTLPDEILCDILKLLDWKYLLAIKLTCRRLRTILKSRILWIFKCSELSLKYGSPVLEGPMESYSVEELEQKVIRSLQIQDRWNSPPAEFRFEELKELEGVHGHFYLVPGGRWLFRNTDGRIHVLDLNKPEQAPHLLFEERRYTNAGVVLDPLTYSAIWIDSSKPWASLRIALHNDSSANLGRSRICIYQLDFNARGIDLTWTVNPVVTLLSSGPSFKKGLRLGEDYVVEWCFYKNGSIGAWKVHVSRYSEPGPRFFVWEYPKPAKIIPLPGDRLVTIVDGPAPHAEIFNIKIPSDSQSLTLELSLRISLHSSHMSSVPRVHVNRHSSYILTTCAGSFQAVQIPHETGASPIVKRFYYGSRDQLEVIQGPSVMVVLRRRCSMTFITYDLQGDSEEIQVVSRSTSRLRGFRPNARPHLIACGEGSGRIIIHYDGAYWLLSI